MIFLKYKKACNVALDQYKKLTYECENNSAQFCLTVFEVFLLFFAAHTYVLNL